MPRQIHHSGQRHGVRGNHVNQCGALVGAQIRIEKLGIAFAHRFGVVVEHRQLQSGHAGPERRDAAHFAHTRISGDRVAQRLESREPASRQRGLAGGQLHHHPQRLDHAARPHLPQRRKPLSRFGVRRKPVADGEADFDLGQRRRQESGHEPAAENGAPGMMTERARPPLPALGRMNPGEHPREPPGAVDIAAQDRERPRQKRRREQHRYRDDDQPADPDRARLGKRRQDERRESDHDRQSRRHHGRARCLNRAHRGVDWGETAVQLLAKARDDEQRVIDSDAQAHHRRDVEHEDGHRLKLGRHGDDPERDRNRQHADDDGQRRRDQRAEGEHKHGQCQRQRPPLGVPRVRGADRPHIVIERRVSRDLHVEPVRVRQAPERALHRLAQLGDDRPAHVGRAGRRQRRDEKGRLAVGADERRFADAADRDDLTDVGLVGECRRDRIDDGREARVRVADGPVHDDGHVFRDRIGK